MAAGKVLSLGLALMVAGPILANDQRPFGGDRFDRTIHARLTGLEENPTLSTTGKGTFRAVITKDNEVFYELSYSGLESEITQSHIHFGKPWVNGGIAVWLCGTPAAPGPATNPPPSCELGTEGTVKGSFTADNVIGPAGQGIAAGEFDELLAAIRAGATYANVHTTGRPSGEIRGLVQ
jgi:hypothetical protein